MGGKAKSKRSLQTYKRRRRIILKWIFRRLCGRGWNGFVWLRIRTIGAEQYNEPLSPIKGREYVISLTAASFSRCIVPIDLVSKST